MIYDFNCSRVDVFQSVSDMMIRNGRYLSKYGHYISSAKLNISSSNDAGGFSHLGLIAPILNGLAANGGHLTIDL